MPIVNIEGEVIFGRVYMLYNSIDNYIYIGSTTLQLNRRFIDHINHYKQNFNTALYNHMGKIGIDKWTIKLLEARIVENILELRTIEQKWIEKYNKDILLNGHNAINKDENRRLSKQKYIKKNKEFLNELKNFNLNDY